MEDRKTILLRAALELLEKQKSSGLVLNLLEETAHYDGADCDGNCLIEDIKAELDGLSSIADTDTLLLGSLEEIRTAYDAALRHGHSIPAELCRVIRQSFKTTALAKGWAEPDTEAQ